MDISYIEFDPDNVPAEPIIVFLDGQNIIHTFYARVPATPGVEAPGRIGFYPQWPPECNPETGNVIKEYRDGLVRWEYAVTADAIDTPALAKDILRLDGSQLEDLARQLVAINHAKADILNDVLACVLEDVPALHTWLATALLGLDGVQQCDLAAEMARHDPRATDAFCVTLGQAVSAVIDPRYNSG